MTYSVSGYASTTDLDHAGHVVARNAFAASIRRKGLIGPRGVKLLAHHDRRMPLGRITALESRSDGLWIEANIDDEISYGSDLVRAIEAAGGLSFSVGFYIEDASIIEDGLDPYLLIERGELLEVSVVTFPCNEAAEMTDHKRQSEAEATLATKIRELKETFA